ncbi:MAG: ATP-dependent Clp protease ATP-binding subunit [Pyrinomonadaceae bacterium]|nr:ATP-dependent Clp protease ATP-binding subunit [Pyrinomonadaceae bacterium]
MKHPLRNIGVHQSVTLAWNIANSEACLSGSGLIEPSHLLLATLRVIDDNYDQAAEKMQLTAEQIASIAAIAAECRALLEMTDEEITAARRALRKALGEDSQPTPIHALQRSTEATYVLQKAARFMVRVGGSELTLAHLLNALLENLPAEAVGLIKDGQKERPALSAADLAGYSVSIIEVPPDAPARQKPEPVSVRTPMINEMGRDLTALGRAGQLMQVVGRQDEMIAIARYLQRTSKRNVLVIGDAGVGKTAVVEGLAQRLIGENTPEFLRRLRIVQISVADLLSGTKYRGDMEERIQKILAEAVSDPNLVLFFDEIHLMMKAGSAGDAPIDIANLLKPALARDHFKCIGATTTEEFERYIKPDAAFMRRFQVLRLNEPSQEEALQICREWARRIEKIQQVEIDDAAIRSAVALTSTLILGRSLPDKAIDVLENATTYIKVASLSSNTLPLTTPLHIGQKEIEEVLEEQYGFQVRASETIEPEKIASLLSAELAGQDSAIASLIESLSVLSRRKEGAQKPLGIFIFTGPTGVGKTFTAETLARAIFGEDVQRLGRFNMGEYKERHELSRLIGAPPGFIGHEKQGALFRFIEGCPQGLILLDEMEKAHPEIQDYFLQIFDHGQTRDTHGRPVDFRHHLFVMTCNILSSGEGGREIGFRAREQDDPADETRALEEQLEEHFRPEFLARVDRVIAFNKLTAKDFEELFERRLKALQDELEKERGTRLEVSPAVREFLCRTALAEDEGARGFSMLFERKLATPLSRYLNADPTRGAVRIILDGDNVSFQAAASDGNT